MNNKLVKKITSVGLSVAVAVWLSGAAMIVPIAPIASAQTTDLQALINSLLLQIQQLQTQITALQSGVPAAPAVAYNFTKNLTLGSKGDDVKALQQYLNASGYQVAASGPGSAGNESTYFGSLTKAALAKWQAANNISPAVGYFGPISRAKYTALAAITPDVPPVVLPTSAYLKVEADGPAATTIPDGSLYNKVLKLKFTAGSQVESVTGVTVSRGGYIANTYITGVSVWDEAGNRYGNIITALTADGKATVSFASNPFVIPAGGTKSLTIKANIDASTGSATVSFSVASASDISVASGSSVPTGTFPLAGNVMSVVDGAASLADLRIDDQSVAGIATGTLTSATGNLEIGDTQKEVFKLRLTQNNSKEAVNVEKITVYVAGTFQEAKDVTNWKLYSPTGDILATAEKPIDRFVTFSLATPYVVDKGLSKDLSVKADIADGSGNYFYVYIQNDYDIVAKGATTGASLQPVDGSGGALAGADTINDNGGFKMKAGSLTVSRASASPSGTVAPAAQNVVLATFDLKAAGEKLEIRKIGVQVKYAGVVLTGTLAVKDAVTGESYLSISADTSNLQTTGTVDATSLLTYQRSLSSYITVESGQTKTLNVVGTVASTATSTSNYKAYVGQFYTKRYSTNDYTDLAPSAYEGSQLNVTDVTLSVTKNQAFANTNRSKGATNVKIAEFVFQASSADDVRINSISFDVASSSFIQNMKVMDGTAQLGSTIGTPSPTGNSISVNVTIAKSASKVLSVYADVLSSATENQDFIVSVAASGISGYGVVSSKSLSSTPGNTLAGQTITVKTGALAIAKDANAPTSKIVVAGTPSVELNSIKFEASNENLTLKKITLQLTTASSTQWTVATSVAANVSKVYLYDGTSLLNTGGTNIVDGDAVIAGLNLPLTQDTPKVLSVKIDATGSGTLTSKSVGGVQVKSTSTTDMEVYSSQGLMSTGLTLTDNAISNYFLFHDVAPTFALATYTQGTGSGAEVGRFTVTNSGVRTMTLTGAVVKASLSGGGASSSVTTFELYDSTNLTTSIATSSATLTGASTSTNVTWLAAFSPTQEIAAGASKTYVVKANVSDIELGVSNPGQNTARLELEIIGSVGYSSTIGSSELYWSDGNLTYNYTPVGATSALTGNNASDSGTVKFGNNTY